MSDRDESPLAKFDAPVLKAIGATDGAVMMPTTFQPTNFGEAMELAKIMSAGNFVPKHLRGKPGDCLAVVMQASRWRADPFAIAQKTYFVNDGIGYEAQLVAAIVNTSNRLKGSLDVSWAGEGEEMVCTVSGTLKGEDRPKVIEQKLKTITTRNSPSWKQAPRQQIGYFTQRLWARLYTPEVLLGIYAVDELEEGMKQVPGNERPKAPTRAQIRQQEQETIEANVQRIEEDKRQQAKAEGADEETGEVERTEEEIARELDAETRLPGDEDAEIQDEEQAEAAQEMVPEEEQEPTKENKPKPEQAAETDIDWNAWFNKFCKDLGKLTTAAQITQFQQEKADRLAQAPAGIKNRVGAQIRTALGKVPAEEQAPAQEEPAGETEEQAPSEDALAEEIINEFKTATLLMDLNNRRSAYQAQIDDLSEEASGRVIKAFRDQEDKLRAGARK